MRYTDEQEAWLAENWARLTNREVADEFTRLFRPMTAAASNSLGSRRGMHKDAGVRERALHDANGPRYTEEWKEWFRSYVPGHEEWEISAECERRFGFALTKGIIGNWKHVLGVRSGTYGGRFKRGHVPANKGMTWDEMGLSEQARANSRATQYRKGDVPHNGARIPIGAERVSKDGYVEVKTKMLSRHPMANDCWTLKHRIEWERANGRPVPLHHMVVFADGDKSNFEPDNLVLVSRKDWAVLSSSPDLSYHDRESLEAAVAVSKLKRLVTIMREMTE